MRLSYIVSGGGLTYFCLTWSETLARVRWLIHIAGIHPGNLRVEVAQ